MRLCRSVWRKVYPPFVWLAKIPIPAAPKTGFSLRFNTLLGYFGIFTTAHRVVVPHFRFKKDLILYLDSSRVAPKTGFPPHNIGGQVRFTPTSSGEFKFKHANIQFMDQWIVEMRYGLLRRGRWASCRNGFEYLALIPFMRQMLPEKVSLIQSETVSCSAAQNESVT